MNVMRFGLTLTAFCSPRIPASLTRSSVLGYATMVLSKSSLDRAATPSAETSCG
jgi:hypothetical protein